MRIALCLSGQPRKALETFHNIYENIVKPNNADVFIHMNYDKDALYIEKQHMDNGMCVLESDIDKKIIELYKPKRYLIEPPRNFQKPHFNVPEKRIQGIQKMNSHKNWTAEDARKHFVKQMTSMYYSIYKSNELKEIYANDYGITYDYVIRLRFDCLPEMPLDCSQLDNRYIHYMELGQSDNLISDWLNIGSNTVMNIYSSLYLQMDYLNSFLYYKKFERLENNLEPSDICGGVSEYMLRDLMTLHKIPKASIRYQARLIY
jgi:hypothetical protein